MTMNFRQSPRFRWPAVLLVGWPLTVLSFYMVLRIEQFEKRGWPTGIAIYYHVVILFAVILLLNHAASLRDRGKLRLSVAELLCIYSMMNIGACFACWESFGIIIPALAYPAYLASTSPLDAWIKPIMAALPSWAIVRDPTAATAFFQGGSWQVVVRGWLVPLLSWGALMSTLFLMYLVLTRLLWESWAHDEKLSFPLTTLPLQMTEPGAELWKSRFFWMGASLAAGLDLINGLHDIVPAIPPLFVKVNYLKFDGAGPALTAVDRIPLTIHPLMLAIGYLLRTDLLFSTWFFYLLGRFQLYVAGGYGIAHGSPYVFLGNVPGLLAQNFGAMFILFVAMIWNSRRVWQRHAQLIRQGDVEAIGNFALLAGGSAVLLIAFNQLGLSVWLAALSLLILFALAVFVTRLRAELGLPVHNLQFMGPDGPLTAIFNGNLLAPHNQEAFGSLYPLSRSLQGHPMPHLMEAAFMADHARATSRRFWIILGLTGTLCLMAGPWLFLWMATRRGMELATGSYQFLCGEGWSRIHALALSPHVPDVASIYQMAGGALFTILLLVAQRYWIGCPFHPVGYAISGSWGTGYVWTPFFIAWLVKSLTLKYAGAGAYKTGVSFALGLILGEFAAGALWTLFSFATGVQAYRIWMV